MSTAVTGASRHPGRENERSYKLNRQCAAEELCKEYSDAIMLMDGCVPSVIDAKE